MRKNIIIVLIVVCLGLGALWYVLNERNAGPIEQEALDGVAAVPEELLRGTIEDAGDGKKKYLHEERGFSFLFDGDLSITTLPDLDGEIILLRDSENGREFQIYATYFDEEGPITVARIQQDLPDLMIEDPQAVKIGPQKQQDALIFIGEDETFGRTREVWFVGGGQLFQVITKEGNDDLVGPILETWEFVVKE